MTRLLLAAFLLFASEAWAADTGPAFRPAGHITSQTTTHLVTAVAGKTVGLYGGSICVDGNGATTGITLQSTGGTNIIGTGVVYVLAAGSCLYFPRTNDPYGSVTAAGTGLDLVTTVGNGPVEFYLEVIQR